MTAHRVCRVNVHAVVRGSRVFCDMSASLSAYELERLDNIRENNLKLLDLGLSAPPPWNAAPLAKKRPTKPKPVLQEPIEPQRRSSRIRSAPAPEVYVEDEIDAEDRRKRRKRPGPALSLGGADAEIVKAELANDPAVRGIPIEPEELTPAEREVYEAIREIRNAKAKSMARSMFIVCGNRTMVEMCRLLPTSKAELLELHGMGELKVQRYGELLLDALRPHVDRLRAHHEAMGLSPAESAGEQSVSTLVAEEAD